MQSLLFALLLVTRGSVTLADTIPYRVEMRVYKTVGTREPTDRCTASSTKRRGLKLPA